MHSSIQFVVKMKKSGKKKIRNEGTYCDRLTDRLPSPAAKQFSMTEKKIENNLPIKFTLNPNCVVKLCAHKMSGNELAIVSLA